MQQLQSHWPWPRNVEWYNVSAILNNTVISEALSTGLLVSIIPKSLQMMEGYYLHNLHHICNLWVKNTICVAWYDDLKCHFAKSNSSAVYQIYIAKFRPLREPIRIGHFTVVVSYLAMNAREAGGDLALMQTSHLFSCKCQLVTCSRRTIWFAQ